MNTYAFASAASEGVRHHGAVTGRRGMAQAYPPSSRSRADRCRPAAANAVASCRDGQCRLRSGNASRPVGNVFRLRRPTPSTAMVFGRAPENFVGRSPAPKVFASNVFFLDARRGGFARMAGRRGVPAVLAHGGRRTRTGMGGRIALHSWRALERQKSSKRNCDSIATPWLLFFQHCVTWVIMRAASSRGGRRGL